LLSTIVSDAPFFLSRYGYPRDLHSFPTRRSSDLYNGSKLVRSERAGLSSSETTALIENVVTRETVAWASIASVVPNAAHHVVQRSEEHTSELQSRENLVCRLLLEKKKQPQKYLKY